MKTKIKTCFLLFATVILVATACRKQLINVSDGFEKPGLSRIWSSDRMERRSFEIESQVVRSGRSAAKITLLTSDTYEAGEQGDLPTERDELREATSLFSLENRMYEFKFSMFLPDTFPVVPVRLVIAQWKEYCGGNDSCSNDSPVVALRYVSDTLKISLQTGRHRTILYERSDIRNHWLDFDFLLRFTQKDNGILKASINGEKIVDYKGVTSYPASRGYRPDSNRYYFKMGLYRDVMKEPMCIYIDDYSKKEIEENTVSGS